MKKRLQKLFAVLLALSMVMSLLSVTAFADESEGVFPVDEVELNPSYTVQYYAYLPVLADADDVTASEVVAKDVIDTSVSHESISKNGGIQIQNTTDLPLKQIYINRADGSVKTVDKLLPLYKDRSGVKYYDAPSLDYINQVDANYALSEVWVMESADSEAVLAKYGVSGQELDTADYYFTNDASDAAENAICIAADNSTVLRLVYVVTDDGYTNQDAVFFDYNITSDGVNKVDQGINDPSLGTAEPRLAFGNANTGNSYKYHEWQGNALNMYNGRDHGGVFRGTSSFAGCTFGLVGTTLGENDLPEFSADITAPDLFSEYEIVVNEDPETGVAGTLAKKVFNDGDNTYVTFQRYGDSYTFSGARATSGIGQTGLDKFIHLSQHGPAWYTNNFFPLDNVSAADRVDPVSGGTGTSGWPDSDDGESHNSYFGMKSEIDFALTEDYIGPLDYLFFGDDDMWVYLDDTLIVDIGGVHSSVGQYVNLWDYLDEDDVGSHTLRFFYTERGASGSSCYMRFTLPSVNNAKPAAERATLILKKDVQDNSGMHGEDEYAFDVTLSADNAVYACATYDKNGTQIGSQLVKNGQVTVVLADDQYAQIEYLPVGTTYSISETVVPCDCCDMYAPSATGCDDFEVTTSETTEMGEEGAEVTTKIVTAVAVGDLDDAESYTVTYVNAYEQYIPVTVTKTWKDGNDVEMLRPDSIRVQLYADGSAVKDPVDVTAENGWTYTWDKSFELPKFNASGNKVVYTVEEIGSSVIVVSPVETPAEDEAPAESEVEINYTEGVPAGYEVSYDGTGITNTLVTSISGTKTWVDSDDEDDVRPAVITIYLLANGKGIDSVDVREDKDGKWTWEFSDLPKYDVNGELIEYTFEEEAVYGYITNYNDDTTAITNTQLVNINGKKEWVDDNNRDGIRPEFVTINLMAEYPVVDGAEEEGDQAPVAVKVTSAVVSAQSDWTFAFENLPKYTADGVITYSITEDAVSGYETDIDVVDGRYVVTNTHEVETVVLEGAKTWADKNDQDGKRPREIVIDLLADGQMIARKTVNKNSVTTNYTEWAWEFTEDGEGNPLYKNKRVDGVTTPIAYTINEVPVADYTTVVDGYNVTNSYTPGVTSMQVVKIWADGNNRDGLRPESIQVQLYADGVAQGDPVTLNSEGDWTYTWTGLDKKQAGKVVDYSVAELTEVEGYTTTRPVERYGTITEITNTHEPETIVIEGSKTWVDYENRYETRPDSIVINLWADGEKIASKTVTEDDGWAWTFGEATEDEETGLTLYKYRDGGVEIKYTITEDKVDRYTTVIDGFDVTNTYRKPSTPPNPPTPPTPPTPPEEPPVIELPDEDPPLSNIPDEDPPLAELPDEDPPLAMLPDEEVPLALLPATGDASALWMVLSALSGTGLVGVSILGRKKRDEE